MPAADYLYFVERSLRGMLAIAEELGDELACTRPDLPGANTAYGLITHCLGVVEYWAGHLVAGRPSYRDRPAEFAATGTVAELAAAVDSGLRRLAEDTSAASSTAAPLNTADADFLGPERELTVGGVLFHVFEEVSQHYGQLEVLRDALRDDVARRELPFAPSLPWLRAKRGVKWRRPGAELIPAWVADMDFPVAEPIRRAITGVLDRGDLGYPDWDGHPLADAFAQRMSDRYGWTPDPAHVRGVTDIIQSLQIVTDLATAPHERVVLQTPNYPPFRASIPGMVRQVVPLHVEPSGDGWGWDLQRLEDELRAAPARLLLLVNPHNPTGHVYSRAELSELAELVLRHDLIVVADEIHAELAYEPHVHVPFASLGPEIAARTVTVTSATKAFNIAGVRTAVAHVGPRELRARWDAQPPDLYGVASVLGVEATLAAWRDCGGWLDDLRVHLAAQRELLTQRLAQLPVRFRPPDATYLAWLDWTPAGLPTDAADFFREKARIELSPGPDYGAADAFARLNFACSTALLTEILDRMQAAVS